VAVVPGDAATLDGTYSVEKPVVKGVPYAQENDLGPSMDFVRPILLQKPVAKVEENNREAH
jgi:hypothetical protein